MSRIATAASGNQMSVQVRLTPALAHWFMLDSLLLANKANREGMHANALSLTRQCLESLSVIELGICGHKDAESVLQKWGSDDFTPGKLRTWLEKHVWSGYGTGLWHEPWATFMREFAAALHPLAQAPQANVASDGQPFSDPTPCASLRRPTKQFTSKWSETKASRVLNFVVLLTIAAVIVSWRA